MPDPPTPTPRLVHDVASTGIAEFDHVLGGLFWGDNVVFEVAEPPMAQPFYRAVAAAEEHYDQRLYVALSDRPTRVALPVSKAASFVTATLTAFPC